jgi:hypothetical protein
MKKGVDTKTVKNTTKHEIVFLSLNVIMENLF